MKKRPHGPKSSWEKVAGWYEGYMSTEGGAYQRDIVFPGALTLLNPKDGEIFLDLACGQGAFSKLLAKTAKVRVLGIDSSKSLIEVAKRGAPASCCFEVGDARKFSNNVKPRSLDGVVCNLAIQNIDNLEGLIREAASVLKTGGRLVLTMNHPCFRQPRQSGWGWDEERKLQYRRVDKYMGEYEMPIQMHPGSAPHLKTYSYHRPLSSYVRTLSKYGFMLDSLEEWISNKESDSGPRAKAENVARREIPMFLGLRAIKSS